MIIGKVNANREAIIQIAVLGNNQNIKSIKAVIDTGYTGDLMLPRAIINELELTLRGLQEAILGDGSLTMFEIDISQMKTLCLQDFGVYLLKYGVPSNAYFALPIQFQPKRLGLVLCNYV